MILERGTIKAILFDMDGVLVDAKDWHYHVLNKALEKYEYFISTEEHITHFDGLPTSEKLKILTEERGLDKNLHQEINNLKQKYTLEIFAEKCNVDLRQVDMLKQLSSNYNLALCSNSKRKTIEVFLEKSATKDFFEFYLSNQDIISAKPDPEIYNKAIKKFKLEPEECLIIEDNFNGIKAAKDSGAYVLEIGDIKEVNYQNIINKIEEIENAK
ncbi:HAD family phosphatase [Rickettsiales bacterium]|nr:HAD family phosphatase [Rickettsiales bacterium]